MAFFIEITSPFAVARHKSQPPMKSSLGYVRVLRPPRHSLSITIFCSWHLLSEMIVASLVGISAQNEFDTVRE
jgi:hypothetical protein